MYKQRKDYRKSMHRWKNYGEKINSKQYSAFMSAHTLIVVPNVYRNDTSIFIALATVQYLTSVIDLVTHCSPLLTTAQNTAFFKCGNRFRILKRHQYREVL
jgi:hypothetical protein